MWPFTKRHTPITAVPEDVWQVGVAEHERGRLFLRLNCWAREQAGHPGYPWQVGIASPIPPGTDLPSVNEDGSPYVKLEEEVHARFERDLAGLVVATITHQEFREIVVYARDREEARQRLEQLTRDTTEIEVQGVIQHDAKWRIFMRLWEE